MTDTEAFAPFDEANYPNTVPGRIGWSSQKPFLLDSWWRLFHVGTDSRGVELEVVAVPDDKRPGGLAVIHAMPTRYRKEGGP